MPISFATEGSGVLDSIFGKSQEPIKLFIEKRGEAFEQASMIKELFAVNPSTHWAEKFTSVIGMDGFKPVGENGGYPNTGIQEGFSTTLENVTWKNQFALSRELMEDAKLMDLRKQPELFTASYYRTREKFGAALFGGAIEAQTAVTFEGRSFRTASADGVCLFSGVHPSKVDSSYTQSNQFADDFSADALAAAEAAMQDFRDDNGEVLDVTPTTILIPNDYVLKKNVFAAIGADKSPDTANNGANFLFGRWNVIVWPYLNQFITAGTHPWILLDKQFNDSYGSSVWIDRVPLEVRSVIGDNDANIWKGYSRFSAGFNDWRGCCVGGISGATQLIAS